VYAYGAGFEPLAEYESSDASRDPTLDQCGNWTSVSRARLKAQSFPAREGHRVKQLN
jgi:hypothetical protein